MKKAVVFLLVVAMAYLGIAYAADSVGGYSSSNVKSERKYEYKPPEHTATATPEPSETLTPTSPSPAVKEVYKAQDNRRPNYVQPQNPTWTTKTFVWESYDGDYTFTIHVAIQDEMYSHYHSLQRYSDIEDYRRYVDDANNRYIVKQVVDSIKSLCEQCGYGEYETMMEAINFVQSIEYAYDIDSTGHSEFQKYPLETLYDQCGDCEDSAILMAAVLRELNNYGCVFIHLPNHVAVGIKAADDAAGTYYEYDGSHYLYIETTNPGWDVGELPEKYRDQSAEIVYAW